MKDRKEYLELATYLKGASDAVWPINPYLSSALIDASEKLKEAGESLCAQGYFGCRGGQTCTSDHK